MQFDDMARKVIEEECEDYFLGIADLSHTKQFTDEQYTSLIAIYPRAVSIGITLPPKTIENSLKRNSVVYTEINNQLNSITVYLSNLLEQEGYKALAVPNTGRMDNGIFVSLHKLAAISADLGRIEKNMVVTSEVGPGVNWGTVLTDAPFGVISK